jgi:hypothetical protein
MDHLKIDRLIDLMISLSKVTYTYDGTVKTQPNYKTPILVIKPSKDFMIYCRLVETELHEMPDPEADPLEDSFIYLYNNFEETKTLLEVGDQWAYLPEED